MSDPLAVSSARTAPDCAGAPTRRKRPSGPIVEELTWLQVDRAAPRELEHDGLAGVGGRRLAAHGHVAAVGDLKGAWRELKRLAGGHGERLSGE